MFCSCRLSAISIENPPNSIPHTRRTRFKQVLATDEYLAGTEESRQDEFDNIKVAATEKETSGDLCAFEAVRGRASR